MRIVTDPPKSESHSTGSSAGGWWHETEEPGRIVCDLCPRECSLKPGDRGFCFVRENVSGEMRLTTYGKSTGFCIDPIEKKPLNHFYPGTPVLSFGTAGCNLGCKFCQNWDISKSREVERLSELAMPDMIAAAAKSTGCRSVAFTYNDPVIWAEYAIDTAKACREQGIKTVAVTAGYITPEARPAFFHAMDAANVDLKAFTEDFYYRITYSHLQPVLDTLRWLKHESDVWFEITNLVIPDANDSPDEFRRMCDWILKAVGADVPVHFTAFHPDFRMTDRPNTPHETLIMARQIAIDQGVRFAYIGNVHDVRNQSTWCPECGEMLIERNWHQLGIYHLRGNHCGACGTHIPGHFDESPGNWGQKRVPIRISEYTPVATVARQREIPDRPPSGEGGCGDSVPGVRLTTSKESDNMQATTESPSLNENQKRAIHQAACEIVAATVGGRPLRLADPELLGAANTVVTGVFVTLRRGEQLRGCVGVSGQAMNLLAALTHSGQRTAIDDRRFPPVSATELPFLTLSVSLLFNFQPVSAMSEDRVDCVEVGKHGLKIVQGRRSGLLLPDVPVEHGWDSRTFLNHVCRKAGLPDDAWQQQESQLLRFEGLLIDGTFDAKLCPEAPRQDSAFGASGSPSTPSQTSQTDADALARFARANIIAQLHGAVPQCFPASVSDGTVDGVAIRISFGLLKKASGTLEAVEQHGKDVTPGSSRHLFQQPDQSVTLSKIQVRGGIPLQMTLLELTQTAASWLERNRVSLPAIDGMTADVIVFTDSAMHATVESPDLRGIDAGHRAVMVTQAGRFAWHFQRDAAAEELVAKASAAAKVDTPATAQILSFAAMSSAAMICHTSVPLPQPGPAVRPAAMAGKFYPADSAELAKMVDDCLGEIPAVKEDWPAIMVPHAGLRFSGRIAGQTLKRVRIRDTVLILGPKHTGQGVEWAVAPHSTWRLPGISMASDPEFARLLTERIDGLELDVAAHAQEHSIEVELPLLARLAPSANVVGITIGGGSLDRCLRFGQQLAAVISGMPSPPLLIISSDMNHFATDEENRRLDEIALKAMESLDPALLFETVHANQISMCGVLPAVIVLETLKCLGQLSQTHRTAYATSADTTADKSRVVGYAGMLIG